jgi:Holliday junction resolvase RusA-like endonuclease
MSNYAYDHSIAMCEPMLIFEIHGNPKPQKQTQGVVVPRYDIGGNQKGHSIRMHDPSKMSKQMIQWQIAPQAPKEPLKGAIAMDIIFYLPIPASTHKSQKQHMINGTLRPYKRPDFDNLAYIVTNALKGIVYRDDGQVVRCLIEKYYHEQPKTVIKVWEI